MMMQGVVPSSPYSPVLFSPGSENGMHLYSTLLGKNSSDIVLDLFASQKKELFKIRHPHKPLSESELDDIYGMWLNGRDAREEGVWVYYPWLNKLIHILDRQEFIELRTNRNHYKISPAEQKALAGKTIGIIGLSVGHSVALTMATERICGKLKLADFDELELSNLNRIRAGIQNIGLNKCIVAAREILEIDPFFEIECFTEGITADNIEAFLLENGQLDILVDECDSLDIKIKARQAAKKHGIPVVMETSDRGMLDVERFDTEPARPLFHGLLEGVPPQMLENIAPQDRIPLTLRIVNATNGSTRGKTSMLEVGRSISTWPQLASAVTLGGGVVTDVCRRLLLGQYNESGRYYVDLETLVADKHPTASLVAVNPFQPFQLPQALDTIASLPKPENSITPTVEIVKTLVEAANQAPSAANDQPWKWVFANGRLFLFHDRFRAFSFADANYNASLLGLGAAYENLLLKAHELGQTIKTQFFTPWGASPLVAAIDFYGNEEAGTTPALPGLASQIFRRHTNRNPGIEPQVDDSALELLKTAAATAPGASLHFITQKQQVLGLGKIIGECDRLMMLNKDGHKDFFERDIRWPGEPEQRLRDGIDIRTMGMVPMQMAALQFIKDEKVAQALKAIGGGGALIDAAMASVNSAWGIGIVSMPAHSAEGFFNGGIAMQRLWLQATALGLALQPLMSPLYVFERYLHANGQGLDAAEQETTASLYETFASIGVAEKGQSPVFMFKISKAGDAAIKSQRLLLDETLFVTNSEI